MSLSLGVPDHSRIVRIGLELACNVDPREVISLQRDNSHVDLKRFPIFPRIRRFSVVQSTILSDQLI